MPVKPRKPSTPSAPAHPPARPSPPPSTNLHAPWRLEYLEAISAKEKAGLLTADKTTGSFLLDDWLNPAADARNHVLVRTREGMILLNTFPYANGHLLVALGEPRPTLLDYSTAQRAALWRLTDAACALLQATLEPQGINIGINQGRAAGAGVPQHLHVHLVPRWGGDVNFMSVVGNVRVIPSSLDAMAARFRAAWARIAHEWA